MRNATFMTLVALLAFTACDDPTEAPVLSPDEIVRPATVPIASDYGGVVLPQGHMTEVYQPYFIVDAVNDIYGPVWHNDAVRVARWEVESDGSVLGPTLLGTLPAPFDDDEQAVRGSNAAGVVVGYAYESAEHQYAGWVWVDGQMKMLPGLPDEAYERTVPQDVNGVGIIVGQLGRHEADGSSADYGVVWLPPYDAEPIELPRAADYELHSTRDITDDGLITGWIRGGDEANGGPLTDMVVQWQIDADGNVLSGPDLISGSEDMLTRRVNDALDVACTYHAVSPRQACVFRQETGQRIDLSPLDGYDSSVGFGLTNRDAEGSVDVVGRSSMADLYYDTRATLWSVDAAGIPTGALAFPHPAPYPDDTQFEESEAYSINDAGLAVGFSRNANGAEYATLWLPGNGGENPPPPTGDGPTASFDYSCSWDDCRFSDTSTGDVVAWSWTSSAGHEETGRGAYLTFGPGTHTVTLTVTDSDGLTDSASTTIDCKAHRRFGARCK